jgi:hypothetical protein
MTTVSRSHDIERFESSARSHEISPELVLVDPELAVIARASLAQRAEKPTPPVLATPAAPPEAPAAVPLYYALDTPRVVHSPAARVAEPPPAAEPRLRGWEAVLAAASHLFSLVTPAMLFLSFLVNLALAGVLLASGGDVPQLGPEPAVVQPVSTEAPAPIGETPAVEQTSAPPSSQVTERARTRPGTKAKAKAGRARAAQARARAKASAERTVLTLLQTAPKARIAALIDPRSGLLKNNVQAVCQRRPAKLVTRFVCAIRVAGAPRRSAVYMRYSVKQGGGWSVTWLRRPKVKG